MKRAKTELAILLYSVAVQGDEPSYRRLFDIFYPSLKKFAACYLRSPCMAGEAASDAMYLLWQRRDRLMEIDNIKVWLYIITRNRCLDILRRQPAGDGVCADTVPVAIDFPGTDPEQICISSEMRKKMTKAVNTLSQRCRLIFKLVKEEGLTYRETADILQLSVRTVDAQLVTALRKITQSVKLEYV